MGLQADERRRKLYEDVDIAAAVTQAKSTLEYRPWLDDWRCRTCGAFERGRAVRLEVGVRYERPTACRQCDGTRCTAMVGQLRCVFDVRHAGGHHWSTEDVLHGT